MTHTAMKWGFVCAVLNTSALIAVALLTRFLQLSYGEAMLVGLGFVIVSAWPFQKAINAQDAADSGGGHDWKSDGTSGFQQGL